MSIRGNIQNICLEALQAILLVFLEHVDRDHALGLELTCIDRSPRTPGMYLGPTAKFLFFNNLVPEDVQGPKI